MKKIIFGITSLTLGGAERVLVDIVNKINREYDITIFTLYSNGEFEKMLSKNVKVISLYNKAYKDISKLKKIIISLKLLFLGKRIYEKNVRMGKYDTEVAFLEGPITRLFATKNADTNKIAWVHNDISLVFGTSINAKLKKKYDRKVYDNYNSIVFVSKDNLEKFKVSYPNINENKLKLIYNYIDADNVIEKSNEQIDTEFKEDRLNFVIVARLTKQKAIDRVLKVHINLIKDGFIHNIYVIGEGSEKEALEKAIIANDVQSTFKLLGKKDNPYPYIKKADVFCLLSLYEGYGMVLEEAKILDRFIIITDTAAREALEDYNNCVIVENNETAIYNGMKEIIQNKEHYKDKVYNNIEYDNSNLLENIKEIL